MVPVQSLDCGHSYEVMSSYRWLPEDGGDKFLQNVGNKTNKTTTITWRHNP
jgi:hypothetical protein